MRTQILTDGCCDFTASERMSSTFEQVPVTVEGGIVRFPTAQAYLDAMDPNAEEIYLVTASAALSNQYEVASQARRLFLGTAPECQVHVFNTRSAGVGELLAARRICQLQRSGYGFRQIVERVEKEILTHQLFLLPVSPEGLRRQGLLPAKRFWELPNAVYTMNLEGHVARVAQAASAHGVEKKLVARLAQQDGTGRTLFISHCGCPERARNLAKMIQQEKRFSSILLTECGVPMSLLLQSGGIAVAF